MLMGLIEVDVVMTQLGGALKIFRTGGRISFLCWVFPWGLSRDSYWGEFCGRAVVWKCRMPCAPPHFWARLPRSVCVTLGKSRGSCGPPLACREWHVDWCCDSFLTFQHRISLLLLVQDLWRLDENLQVVIAFYENGSDFQIALRLDIICVYWSEHWLNASL